MILFYAYTSMDVLTRNSPTSFLRITFGDRLDLEYERYIFNCFTREARIPNYNNYDNYIFYFYHHIHPRAPIKAISLESLLEIFPSITGLGFWEHFTCDSYLFYVNNSFQEFLIYILSILGTFFLTYWVLIPPFFCTCLIILIPFIFRFFPNYKISILNLYFYIFFCPILIFFFLSSFSHVIFFPPTSLIYLLNDKYVFFDNYSYYFLIILSFFILFFISFINDIFSQHIKNSDSSLLLLIGFFFLFCTILPCVQDLFLFYFILEGITFFTIFFFVVNFDRKCFISSALKYFCLNAFASGALLMSIIFIYLLSGTTNYYEIAAVFTRHNWEYSPISYTAGLGSLLFYNFSHSTYFFALFFFTITFLFKLTLLPFSTFLPDFYKDISYILIFFFGIIYKVIFFFSWLKLVLFVYPLLQVFGDFLFYIGLFSALLGAVGAFSQKSVKRFFAYTTINNMGFIILSFSIFTLDSLKTSILYMIIYFFGSMLVFLVFSVLSYKNNTYECLFLNQLSYVRRYPILVIFLTIGFLSLAGFPPTAGFFAKFFILLRLIETGSVFSIILFFFINILSLIYYFRILRIIWLEPINLSTKNYVYNASLTMSLSYLSTILLSLISIFIFFFIFFSGWFTNMVYFCFSSASYPLASF